ncbi:EAL domain-containing protein [uncultured Desulfuromonas sp.]|uniref:putative bifunctional diguanylate cyclase/phosphodiesterase n=1 Tax=uncultured Desulfuromonas sp. TaxID=181013 RepID=UPI002612211C|nr:EAL domain-containing protein [uncultured Desulfuromonas sp.]
MTRQAEKSDLPRVLIVDDDMSMRLLMRASLEQAGFAVDEAEDGWEALKSFERSIPDLVFLDLVMPGMDGFATCEALKELPGGRRTPVIIMTGLEDVESVHMAFDVGADDFLTKPFNWAMLGYRARYVLRANGAMLRLAKSEARLAEAHRIAQLGSWELDLERDSFHCSPELGALLGIEDQQEPPDWSLFVESAHPEDRGMVTRVMGNALEKRKSYSLTYRLNGPGPDNRVVQHLGEVVCDGRGRPSAVVGTVQDVTELKRAEEKVKFLAYHDSLTGLANRHLFNDRTHQAIAACKRSERSMALLFLDLDRFKRINDNLGHRFGDTVLTEIARRILGVVRKCDSISRPVGGGAMPCVSRRGGDEFTILLAEITQPRDAAGVAARVLDAISQPLVVEGREVLVTASIGISLFPEDGTDLETLMKNADIAMYQAKDEGRNKLQFFNDSMNLAAAGRLTLESEIRKGLAGDEFRLFYQPLVDFLNGSILGVEALIRWDHPERGLLSPGAFISVAEESGLIFDINAWVLQTACVQIKTWQEAGLCPQRVAVNLSGEQYALERIIETVSTVLRESCIDSHVLEIELSENLVMKKEQDAALLLSRLKDLGIRIAVDDFGTGYSSLSHLKSFPIDTLKIDRAFIKDIATEGKDAAIARSIVALAHSLELDVIAEGVEMHDQAVLLGDEGCQFMQGYLFSHPLPVREISEVLRRGIPDMGIRGISTRRGG